MNRIKTIAVIGATGMLGAPVTNILKKEGFAVTAVVRDPAKGSNRLVQNIHIQKGDLRDKSTLKHAFENVDYIYLSLSTDHSEKNEDFKTEINGLKNVIQAAEESGVKRIGMLSSLVKDYDGIDWWVFDIKRKACKILLDCDIPATIFYPSNFYENLAVLQMKGNRLFLAGDQVTKSWWIGTKDYGKQVAAAFRQEHTENREYPVQGTEPYNFEEAADLFIKHYKPVNLKKSKTPLWILKTLKPFSPKIDFQYNILYAINHYRETFLSEQTWEDLGKPQQTLAEFAESFS